MPGWDDNDIPTNAGWPDLPIDEPTLSPRGYTGFDPSRASPSGGGLPWPGTPVREPLYPGGLPGAGPGAGAGMGALTASGFDLPELLKTLLGVSPFIAGAIQGQPDMPQGLQGIIDLQRQRLEASNPLYESVLRLAFSRLPSGATQGLPMPQMPRPGGQ